MGGLIAGEVRTVQHEDCHVPHILASKVGQSNLKQLAICKFTPKAVTWPFYERCGCVTPPQKNSVRKSVAQTEESTHLLIFLFH